MTTDLYPTPAEVIARVVADVRRAARRPADPAQIERYAGDILARILAEAPCVTDFLPELTLRQVLSRIDDPWRGGAPAR